MESDPLAPLLVAIGIGMALGLIFMAIDAVALTGIAIRRKLRK